jgi:hypothetical protein
MGTIKRKRSSENNRFGDQADGPDKDSKDEIASGIPPSPN